MTSSEHVKSPAPRPCSSCPYRRDVPSGIWAAEEYAKLRRYDRDTWDQPGGLFLCHQSGDGDPNSRLCAGWVGCHGDQLLALRLAVGDGRVDVEVMSYTTDVELFGSGGEAAAHGMADILAPEREALAAILKIAKQRNLNV